MKKFSFDIYHNPRCSKSRKALKILNSKTKDFKIIKYLEEGIDIIKLKSILSLNEMYKDKVDISIEDNLTDAEDVGTKVIVTLKKD